MQKPTLLVRHKLGPRDKPGPIVRAICASHLTVYAGCWDAAIYVLNLQTGDVRNFRGHFGSVFCVNLAADGNTVISGAHDGKLLAWNLQGQKQYCVSLPSARVMAVCFGPEDQIIYSGGLCNTVVAHDRSGIVLHEFEGHTGYISQVLYHSGTLYSASGDGTIRKWDVETQTTTQVFTPRTRAFRTTSFCLNNEGTRLYVCAEDSIILEYDLSQTSLQRQEPDNSLRGFTAVKSTAQQERISLMACCMSSSQHTVLAIDSTGTVFQWPVLTGDDDPVPIVYSSGYERTCQSGAYHPGICYTDGLIVTAVDDQVLIWDDFYLATAEHFDLADLCKTLKVVAQERGCNSLPDALAPLIFSYCSQLPKTATLKQTRKLPPISQKGKCVIG